MVIEEKIKHPMKNIFRWETEKRRCNMNLENKARLLLETIERLEKLMDANGNYLDEDGIYDELLEIKQSLNTVYY